MEIITSIYNWDKSRSVLKKSLCACLIAITMLCVEPSVFFVKCAFYLEKISLDVYIIHYLNKNLLSSGEP